ncbi:uncharacterized protein LOC122378917 isoform X2 [Amphibalanus amphitrite]|nr:uncharacterized protein LOC122378917 isoform X2 [Amphibalanus amphitrite]XP_043216501.1 uncharacterized protein LOC122378917 isoform X2 [Amphibalanus amphitrite]
MESDTDCESHSESVSGDTGLLACGDNADEWPRLGGGAAADHRLPVVPARLRSCAEVKFALLDRLPGFTEPDLHTDLRRARAATVPLWSPGYARDMDAWQREVLHQQRLADERPEFSSFCIANMSMDCLDGVDVISEGENIKKLLKLAYNNREEISMVVHRVGRLLLLDDFDITTHLLETEKTEWVWLDRLLREHFLTKFQDEDWARRAAAEEEAAAVDTRSAELYSRLLLHTVTALPSPAAPAPAPALLALPAPSDIAGTPPPPRRGRYRRHYFARNMLWTFQDLKMLIGTDMPILGGGTHPCVSLRLHDLSEPINVLTGLDYWLDNLMSNVPEVLMCYHVDGVLRKYSLIKTEELPYLPDSTFRPEVVHDVAENILSFLRANATKTGHTYWLFKGEDDDCVKLYDLSSLLESRFEGVGRDDNPFSGHVALLLYRIACNMLRKRHVVDFGDRLGTVRTILNKTLELIKADKYLQVRANIHMMLADCYVPRDHRPLTTEFAGGGHADAALARSPERTVATDSPWSQQPMVRVDLLARKGAVQPSEQDAWEGEPRPQPIAGDARERTERALEHVLSALDCLRRRNELERDDKAPKMAHPAQAIPMPYCPLNEVLVAATSEPPTEAPSEASEPSEISSEPPPPPPPPPTPTHEGDVTEMLLYQKAAHLCSVRAAAAGERGDALPALRMAWAALRCVAAAGGSGAVPEVTAAASILVSDGLLLLSRAPAADTEAARAAWWEPTEPVERSLLQRLREAGADTPPEFVGRPARPPGVAGDMDMLEDAVRTMESAATLKLSPEMRQHVRTRQGLLLNEIGLLYSRRLEDVMKAVDSGPAASLRARAEAQRRPMEQGYKRAESAFCRAVSLLEGSPQRCATEMNLGHLYNRAAAAHHQLFADAAATVSDLERTAACYGRAAAAAAAPGRSTRFAEQTAAVVGCADFAARMRLLRSGVGYRLALLHGDVAAAGGAPGSAGRQRAVQELFRKALALCDPALMPAGAERRQVCFHAAEVIAMHAVTHEETARLPTSERRRAQLYREALDLYGQSALRYQEAGRPDRLLAMLHAQTAVKEHQAAAMSHWFSRVKLVEEAMTAVASPSSPLAPLLVAGEASLTDPQDPELAERVQKGAQCLFESLLNALKTVCLLLRKYGGNKKKQTPAYFEELYRQCLAASLRSGTGFSRLSSLVQLVRKAQKPGS